MPGRAAMNVISSRLRVKDAEQFIGRTV